MVVVRCEITRREPFADGISFGAVGPYERFDGFLHYAVDPLHGANRSIVDLDRAPRNAQGRATFRAGFCLLHPADPARARRSLLYFVVNRGRLGLPMNRPAVQPEPVDRFDYGDGFLMCHGWTVGMAGWQWDVEPRPGLIGLDAPQAMEGDRPIQGEILVQFQPNEPHPDELLAHMPLHPPPGKLSWAHRPYPAADLDDPRARLTVKAWPGGPRYAIERSRWRFARDVGGRPVPDDRYVWLEGGFQPGLVYELVYRTRICPVVGTGLLATRDCISFLRYGTAAEGNPLAGVIDVAHGFGVSQCGRFLRQFLYDAQNLDESGRVVFDGVIPDVAGARRGEFNHRFAQPSSQHAFGFGHMPPFTDGDVFDPVTGVTDGLLRRQRERGGVPKVITPNTSSEYWRIDCSLIHTDPTGAHDVEPPPGSRVYLMAGTQHGPGTLPLNDLTPAGARGAHSFDVVDYMPVLRAMLESLDRWVRDGVEPPPSVFPRLADGTAVPREHVLEKLARIPGVTTLDPALLPRLARVDLGPEASRGIGCFPARAGATYASYVSDVDESGNEVCGIRLPDLTAPVGSHLGWIPRHVSQGGLGQGVDMYGSTIPLPATRAERERRDDPRLAIGERYRDREDYLARVRAAAEELARQRYLLVEDVEVVVANCAVRYDAFAAIPAGATR
ncbi:MAG: hypothetical protein FJ033_01460 [Chloroflexi bacterium]|nr:hypothetical protein [Chloroflexota bacterium]